MPVSPRRYLPEKTFLRKLLMLSSGTIAGQAIVIASSPLLTRLFTPVEFGHFAVFAALISIAGVAACWRFEFAVPVLRADADAAAMIDAAALATVLMALMTALVVLAFGDRFARLVEAEALAPWLWLLPVAVLAWGLGSLGSYWSLRRGTYRANGLNRTLTHGSQAGGQLALGVLGAGMPGLIVGYLFGYGVRLCHYVAATAAADRRLFAQQRPRDIWRVARRSWRYPVFSAPSSLLLTFCEMAPAIVIAALFGPAMAGWYALAHRLMGLPVKLLGEAASQVFLGEGRDLAGADLHHFFLRTFCLFVGLGAIGMLPLLFVAPPLFALLFGEAWREAGVIVQLLVPLHLARFVAVPVSQLLIVLQRQEIQFVGASINVVALLASFGVGHLLSLDSTTTILLFSSASAAAFALVVLISWVLVRQAGSGRSIPEADN